TRNSEDVLWGPPPPAADERLPYGPEPKQFGDLRLPPGEGAFPLATVLHGGYWKAQYNLSHTGQMCTAPAAAGIATWNLEYPAGRFRWLQTRSSSCRSACRRSWSTARPTRRCRSS